MSSLLDTNIVLYHLAGIPEAVSLVSRLAAEGIAVSIVTYMELYQSTLRRAGQAPSEAKLAEFLNSVPVLPFSLSTARRCAALREQLARDGKRVRQRALDLLIAATALEHNLILVTRNREDFEDIPDLQTLFYESS
jgi:tRNA(fMet)-specific endonuclease VapC